ncbi:class I mannose-6-phosphate isomerase [Tamlana sp. 2201CG12-4]|uniref:class I mannose-6-phosphate isomerase n=1 Tax=Tamlana sp. 2201CG12-4 TaxID=3112582 RepID=UPI002DBBE4FD|nr:class I mannose-6-phosphate isomerase [Tamlana sp. 2201CG12-4]MEC3907040.1 class I mannose-6-phosphate isomerase [Tamlana sp. 2201CG12-4]
MKRKTSQYLIPVKKGKGNSSGYDINPVHKVSGGKINTGYESLVDNLVNEQVIILDGYIGVDWQEVVDSLVTIFKRKGRCTYVYDIKDAQKSEEEINTLVSPFLGGDDPIFGHKTSLILKDYFDQEKLDAIDLGHKKDLQIIYGTGASLSNIKGCLVYFDLPKNELQFRMRADAITNLGLRSTKAHKQMYKHFYFVDWVVLNKEKKRLLPQIDIIVDQQRPEIPTWTKGEALRASLSKLSRGYFRVRPWFEPGVWGGQWIKEHIEGLNQEVPNYAWSFEMIVPENGLVFGDDNGLLEVSFDMLMFQDNEHVLGKAAKRFQDEFPIRFDFLDTFDGGNLSVQCHPKPDYIKKEFGENFTQDETYYILDAGEDADVYLGFQEDIDPEAFKKALEHSYKTKEELDVEQYVQKLPAKKHDLFLIPHGTVHCSGINNLVLEISATPYIFTFKMYDWQRMDMDGNPRPLNINRAYDNLNFSRKGQVVQETLISKPYVESSGENWKKIHLPTHVDHFYDIYRYEFDDEVIIETLGQCHVLMLVEGTAVELDLVNDSQTFYYAETFAVSAAANSYKLINKSRKTAKVIVSFVKDEAC